MDDLRPPEQPPEEGVLLEDAYFSSLTPHCRNCDWYVGYALQGWCWLEETFVKGACDCPKWELRGTVEMPDEEQTVELGDEEVSVVEVVHLVMDKLRVHCEERSLEGHYREAELPMMKLLRAIRLDRGEGYDE